MDLLNELNPMQREACLATEGPLLILAGAGSGKTRVITYRTAKLIENGVSPDSIIAITFTNKAANEMRERITAITPRGMAVWVSTFHSMCVRILRREAAHIDYGNKFTIYDADDSARLIKNCLKELNINEKLFSIKAIAAAISRFKDELLTPEEAQAEADNVFLKQVSTVYALYQSKLKTGNAFDFDDLLSKTIELFTARPDILQRYQERFRYIMVDEYQDTNTAQYNLVRVLAEKYKNICVVGDDDQSIYAWRGANIRNILEFEKQYPNALVIKLEQNYRSTKTILDCANSVIKNNSERKEKNLWTSADEGEKTLFYNADNDYDEARFIVSEVIRLKQPKLSSFAVLYRINALSRVIEEAFVRNGTPYRIFGGVNFYARREIKDITAYLKLINNRYDVVSFERIINVPRRGIGDGSIEKIRNHANETGTHMFDAAKDWALTDMAGRRSSRVLDFVSLIESMADYAGYIGVADLIEKILEETNYKEELLSEDDKETARERVENIESLIAKAREYDETAARPSLAEFLEDIALVADIDGFDEKQDAVSLMTLHNCKGLEFPYVFIAGFEEGLMPSYRSVASGDTKDVEEERRICYVGMTRAKKRLYLTAAKRRTYAGSTNYNPPSRFFEEIDKDLIEITNPRLHIFNTNGTPKTPAFAKTGEPEDDAFAKTIAVRGARKPEYWQNYTYKSVIPAPKDISLSFAVGDTVSQIKYGKGEVLDIAPAGADYEITIRFEKVGIKKLMSQFARLKKVEL